MGKNLFKDMRLMSSLQITGNYLKELPDLSPMPSLTELRVYYNALDEIPDLRGVPGLVELDVSGNRIKHVPAFHVTPGLKSINLGEDTLRVDRAAFKDLKNLKYITGNDIDRKFTGVREGVTVL